MGHPHASLRAACNTRCAWKRLSMNAQCMHACMPRARLVTRRHPLVEPSHDIPLSTVPYVKPVADTRSAADAREGQKLPEHTCRRAHAQATFAVSCALRIGSAANAWRATARATCCVAWCCREPIAQRVVVTARGAMVPAVVSITATSAPHTRSNASPAQNLPLRQL